MNPKLNVFSRVAGIAMILALNLNCAQAGEHGERNDRAERREARMEQRTHERAAQQDHQAAQQDRQTAQQGPASAEVKPELPRRPGRMTPEERRALRRQINEAGQDIYSRKNW